MPGTMRRKRGYIKDQQNSLLFTSLIIAFLFPMLCPSPQNNSRVAPPQLDPLKDNSEAYVIDVTLIYNRVYLGNALVRLSRDGAARMACAA
jgi:hypothetical protein